MLAKQRAERVKPRIGPPPAVFEDLRLADRAADPEGYQPHTARHDKACTPSPSLHSFIVRKERQGEPDRNGYEHARVDGEMLPRSSERPSIIGSGLDKECRCRSELAARRKPLDEARNHENDRRGHADRRIRRADTDDKRRTSHQRNREGQSPFAAITVAERAEYR